MRRASGLWPRIVAFDNLCASARRAARGKRRVAGAARFLADLEPRVLTLQGRLANGAWRPGRAFNFVIHDPKRRTITAAPFEDRVVHHALMDVLEPVLDRRMLQESFACRRGKGTHAALRHARSLVRRHAWFLKLDIEHCFESLAHGVVLETVARVVKDRRVLELCGHIVHAGGIERRGLPIGNLSSQWFANLVLDRIDHFIKERLRVRGYVRYMDDFVLFADAKDPLARAYEAVEAFVHGRLKLRLKERATILAPVRQGLPFLGWRIHRGTTRLRPENLRRTRRRLKRRLQQYHAGQIDEGQLASSVRSVTEHLRHGNTLFLRRGWNRSLEGEGPSAPRTA
ncbi:MAG: reverse transcriptase/maturase family protein [Planctomycetota bacterium]